MFDHYCAISITQFSWKTISITNPLSNTQSYSAAPIGTGGSKCWTSLGEVGTAVYRWDITPSIANNGTYVAPRIVSGTIDKSGKLRSNEPSSTRPVLTQTTATQMNLMMRDVVCTGTARGRVDIPGYTIAGKTGTGYKAQKNGTYFDEDGNRAYYASFVGFFPAENPQVTILVSIDEPPPTATMSVSPTMIFTCATSTPSMSAATCAKLVSWPWPEGCVPITTSITPSGRTVISVRSFGEPMEDST